MFVLETFFYLINESEVKSKSAIAKLLRSLIAVVESIRRFSSLKLEAKRREEILCVNRRLF